MSRSADKNSLYYFIEREEALLIMQELNEQKVLGWSVKIKPEVEKLGGGLTPIIKIAYPG